MTLANLTRRNVVVFFRDPAAVFFSLLSPIILFVLFSAFLGGVQTDALQKSLPTANADDVDTFVYSWVIANLVMITTATTSLSALVVFVNDRVGNVFRDFLVSPISRFQLILSYLLGAFVVSTALSTTVFVLADLYLGIVHSAALSVGAFTQALAQLVGFCLLFSAIWSFVVTFIGSAGVFTSVATIVGTAGGFLAGAYITVGALPSGVVTFMNVLPLNQSATLMRGPFTRGPLDALVGSSEPARATAEAEYGLLPYIASAHVPAWAIWALFAGLFTVFVLLGAWRIGRRIG
ncbi:ABC transporter permease [Tsukamurella ocularis]|uniref:ABC transporter permease n=1 Tax=Tsukamurella ocularis TaxID=1970234 RepID=UPI0021676C74|nr:ABC transporter permease [Tsukamurella ocularis]MCS3780480.1 multidrug/hemolysin transport system permease protein [Tsukamurella ocularis]MCS3785965.1 multidrug/hemolysin transport system permease protein [Tsukamurella ocularis]MCS3849329.1 multidrug/hemolysin transport system permease protein [Tsukamurella ocularis]